MARSAVRSAGLREDVRLRVCGRFSLLLCRYMYRLLKPCRLPLLRLPHPFLNDGELHDFCSSLDLGLGSEPGVGDLHVDEDFAVHDGPRLNLVDRLQHDAIFVPCVEGLPLQFGTRNTPFVPPVLDHSDMPLHKFVVQEGWGTMHVHQSFFVLDQQQVHRLEVDIAFRAGPHDDETFLEVVADEDATHLPLRHERRVGYLDALDENPDLLVVDEPINSRELDIAAHHITSVYFESCGDGGVKSGSRLGHSVRLRLRRR